MALNDFQSIYSEFLPRYKACIKSFNKLRLERMIVAAANKAKENYNNLPDPKSAPIKIYMQHWVRDTLEKDFASRTLRQVSVQQKTKSTYIKALANYCYYLPPEILRPLSQKLYSSPLKKRPHVWKDFALPLDKLEKLFIEVAIARNEESHKNNFDSYIDFTLSNNKIPKSSFEVFIKKAPIIIQELNKQLLTVKNNTDFYSEFSLPCFLCRIPLFPFRTLNDVLNFVTKEYPEIEPYKHKIKISYGEKIFTQYQKEDDTFQVMIDKDDNIRHQLSSLVHELGHVIAFFKNFKKNQDPLKIGRYLNEKEAFEIEISLIRKLGNTPYRAYFGKVLLNLRRVLFEIALYTKPKQDLSKLYAKTFNHCFKKAKQTPNHLYLLDERIISSPLSSLPHAVAQVETFLTLRGKCYKGVNN